MVELRHYLIIIHSKWNENILVTFMIFVLMCLNYFYIVISNVLEDMRFSLIILGGVLFLNFTLIYLKRSSGFITSYFYNVGVNIGLIVFVMTIIAI